MYKLSEKVVLQKLGPEVVVFRFSDERFFSLDSVASKMLEAIIEAGDPQRAASALLQYYDIDQATLEADVLAFVEKCEREGFLVRTKSA
ncbi:MAG: PqqD family protein [Rhodanobacteraceae bacterium]|nr:PqqD family protein [Rhodanobacteraceae bacterium]